MKKNPLTIYLFAFCLTFSINNLNADSVLSELPFLSGETLHYKLSYRGLLTSMIWADIADASMTFMANQQSLDGHEGHQFILSLSTENYNKAELIYPVRYTYIATVDKSFQKTWLVEEIDLGINQSHDFLWLDWQNKTTQLFKKREKINISSGLFDLDTKEIWEQDGELPLPDFLTGFPVLEDNQSYFIHKESGDKISCSQILEPLSLIYTLRTLDTASEVSKQLDSISSMAWASPDEVKEIAIAVSDDIRLYRIAKIGLQELTVAGKKYQAIKYKIQTDEKKDNSYYIWLNNDSNKIPLRLSMDAPLGKLEIDLVKITQTKDHKIKRMGNWTIKPFQKG